MRVGFSAPEPDPVDDTDAGAPDATDDTGDTGDTARHTIEVEVGDGPAVVVAFEGWWLRVDLADLDSFERFDEREVTVMHSMLAMCTRRAERALELFR